MHGGDGQSDDETIGVDLAGMVHHLFFRARDPHGAVPGNGCVEIALMQQIDHDGIVAGGIDDNLALEPNRVDVNEIVAGHFGGRVVHDNAFQDSIPTEEEIADAPWVEYPGGAHV